MDYQQIAERIESQKGSFAVMREPDTDTVLWFDGEEAMGQFVMCPFDEKSEKRECKATTEKEYKKAFDQIKEKLYSGEVDKVVLSRIIDYDFSIKGALREYKESIKGALGEVFIKACLEYPHQMIYLSVGDDGIWLGCTPELLLSYDANTKEGRTMALAGTRSIMGSDVKWDEKNVREQAVVSQWIGQQLKEEGVEVEMSAPYTTQAGGVEHLRTDISMTLSDVCEAKKIVKKLHPTPAVCGQPRIKALEIIRNVELHDRENYSGYVGWESERGLRLYVNLRCAKIDIETGKAHIFVGGGIMPDSICEEEIRETEMKAGTIKRVLS